MGLKSGHRDPCKRTVVEGQKQERDSSMLLALKREEGARRPGMSAAFESGKIRERDSSLVSRSNADLPQLDFSSVIPISDF